MARIAGVLIPDKKKIRISLTSIYGIGQNSALKILDNAGISPEKRTDKLEIKEIGKLRDIIEKNHQVEGALRKDIMLNIKHLRDIGTYRGTRHSKSLPSRGQRTKTNSRTRRGNVRRTMGSGRKKLDKK